MFNQRGFGDLDVPKCLFLHDSLHPRYPMLISLTSNSIDYYSMFPIPLPRNLPLSSNSNHEGRNSDKCSSLELNDNLSQKKALMKNSVIVSGVEAMGAVFLDLKMAARGVVLNLKRSTKFSSDDNIIQSELFQDISVIETHVSSFAIPLARDPELVVNRDFEVLLDTVPMVFVESKRPKDENRQCDIISAGDNSYQLIQSFGWSTLITLPLTPMVNILSEVYVVSVYSLVLYFMSL